MQEPVSLVSRTPTEIVLPASQEPVSNWSIISLELRLRIFCELAQEKQAVLVPISLVCREWHYHASPLLNLARLHAFAIALQPHVKETASALEALSQRALLKLRDPNAEHRSFFTREWVCMTDLLSEAEGEQVFKKY